MTFEEFTKLVNSHDLTYSYSDDGEVWRRGQEVKDKILREAKNFPEEDVRRVWNEMVDSKLAEFARKDFYWKGF